MRLLEPKPEANRSSALPCYDFIFTFHTIMASDLNLLSALSIICLSGKR